MTRRFSNWPVYGCSRMKMGIGTESYAKTDTRLRITFRTDGAKTNRSGAEKVLFQCFYHPVSL
jgi:hypothetical protein